MAQAKSCHDELETYYRAAVDLASDEAAAECMEMFGLNNQFTSTNREFL